MAPLPSNTTGVAYVDYNTCGEDHTVQLRYQSGSTAADALDVLAALFSALDTTMRPITIIGARNRNAGGNVTTPVSWPGDPTYGTGDSDHNNSAYYVDFIGRSEGGRRVRVSFFGAGFPADTTNKDFRLQTSENAAVAACVTALEAASGVACAIDGGPALWKHYANIGTNAYWRNHIR